MTGDHAREWTSVPRRSRRDDGACPIPPNRAPTPVRASRTGSRLLPESTRRGTHLLGLLGATFGRHGRELRTAVGRGTLGDVWRSERSGPARAVVASLIRRKPRDRSPRPLASCVRFAWKMNSAAPCQVGFFEGASLQSTARHGHARVMRGDGTARRSRHASPRLARGAPRRRGAPPPRGWRGPMTVRRARSRQRTAPSARWTPCSACPATKTRRPPRRNRTVSSRTRTAKSRRAIPPKPTR